MPTYVPCAQCGAELHRYPCLVKRSKHHFCDFTCKGAYMAQHNAEENNPHWHSIEIPCTQCGAIVLRTPSQMKSREHAFCNNICYGAYQSMHSTGSGNHNWGGITIPCTQCGAMLNRPPSQANTYAHQFCNKACHGAYLAQYNTGEKHHLWRGGHINYYGPNWHTQQRATRKRDGYKCQCCGKPQKKCRRALDVHHVKPFRSFGYIAGVNENYLPANELTNLVSLCGKCHKQAEDGAISIQPYLL